MNLFPTLYVVTIGSVVLGFLGPSNAATASVRGTNGKEANVVNVIDQEERELQPRWSIPPSEWHPDCKPNGIQAKNVIFDQDSCKDYLPLSQNGRSPCVLWQEKMRGLPVQTTFQLSILFADAPRSLMGIVNDGPGDTSVAGIEPTWSIEGIYDLKPDDYYSYLVDGDCDSAMCYPTFFDFEDETTHSNHLHLLLRDSTLEEDTQIEILCY